MLNAFHLLSNLFLRSFYCQFQYISLIFKCFIANTGVFMIFLHNFSIRMLLKGNHTFIQRRDFEMCILTDSCILPIYFSKQLHLRILLIKENIANYGTYLYPTYKTLGNYSILHLSIYYRSNHLSLTISLILNTGILYVINMTIMLSKEFLVE